MESRKRGRRFVGLGIHAHCGRQNQYAHDCLSGCVLCLAAGDHAECGHIGKRRLSTPAVRQDSRILSQTISCTVTIIDCYKPPKLRKPTTRESKMFAHFKWGGTKIPTSRSMSRRDIMPI